MTLSASVFEILRACSRDERSYQQLVSLFENQIAESTRLYRLLADHFPNGMVALFDHELRFLLANGQGLARSGLSTELLRGKRMQDVFPEDIALRDEPHIRAALAGEARVLEVAYGGQHYLVRTLPVHDETHQIVAAMVMTQDITERKQMEQQLAAMLEREQQALRDAEKAIETQRLFLGMVSHELRTPLSSIKGFSSTLLAPDITFEPDVVKEFLTIIDNEADKLTELIEQLLDVVRLRAGTLKVQPEATVLPDIITSVQSQLESLTTQHRLHIDLARALPPLVADPRRIGQVITNLVSNAVKFSPSQSLITITADAADGVVKVSVQDEGEGFPPSERTAVFTAFYRLSRDERVKPGSGLGLAICKGIVEAHGGEIWIDEQPGPGSTVSFTLPVRE